jgi:hypothetical protein
MIDEYSKHDANSSNAGFKVIMVVFLFTLAQYFLISGFKKLFIKYLECLEFHSCLAQVSSLESCR